MNDDPKNWYTEEVAMNPNTSPEILANILRKRNDDNVSYFAVRNPNCPQEVLVEILRTGKDNRIAWQAALNPKCPREILLEIFKGGNDCDSWITQHAIRNPNCPLNLILEILGRGELNYTSIYASRNPNCPPLVKVKWMRKVGLIGKEDPAKHIIEYDSKEEVDKDLEELEKLLKK